MWTGPSIPAALLNFLRDKRQPEESTHGGKSRSLPIRQGETKNSACEKSGPNNGTKVKKKMGGKRLSHESTWSGCTKKGELARGGKRPFEGSWARSVKTKKRREWSERREIQY